MSANMTPNSPEAARLALRNAKIKAAAFAALISLTECRLSQFPEQDNHDDLLRRLAADRLQAQQAEAEVAEARAAYYASLEASFDATYAGMDWVDKWFLHFQ
jgi:hypothetical protein